MAFRAFTVARIPLCRPGSRQDAQNLRVRKGMSKIQRRIAGHIHDVHAGIGGKKELHRAEVAGAHCKMQGGLPCAVRLVNPGAGA